MTRVADIQPDVELKKVLDGQIIVYVASNSFHRVSVYAQAERPDTELNDEFIEILNNGVTTALVQNPMGVFTGNLSVNIYCKLGSKATVKRNRTRDIISQIEREAQNRRSGRYFFHIDPYNVITQPTSNSSGYSTAAINVRWRMDEEPCKIKSEEDGGQ